MVDILAAMLPRLYALLQERGDKFLHRMTSVHEIGDVTHEPTLSSFDESTYQK